MPTSSAKSTTGVLLGLLVAAVIVAAAIVGIVVVAKHDTAGDRGSGLASNFDFDIEKFKRVDPKLIHYRQTAEFPVGGILVRAIAAGPNDEIYVAGDESVIVMSAAGKQLRQVAIEGTPSCLAVGGPDHAQTGRLYVGVGDHVQVFGPDGGRVAGWASHGEKAALTSIALSEENAFVADAGNEVVWRCDLDGKVLGKIGAPDPDRGVRGFFIPSPHFDVAVTHDQLLRVVNPGARRIEAFTFDGDPMLSWGKAGPNIDRFFGCCNPASMCLLPDDRFVTAEKGLPRIKVYDIDGKFESVVASPEQLVATLSKLAETRTEHQTQVFDVAADSRGHILVLDPHRQSVRVFEKKGEG